MQMEADLFSLLNRLDIKITDNMVDTFEKQLLEKIAFQCQTIEELKNWISQE